MNDKLVYSFTEYLRLQFSYDDDEIAKIKYSLEVFLYDFEKLLILFIIFFQINKSKEFVLCTLVLISIRTFAGGMHFNTFRHCFLASLLIFVLSIVILPMIPLNLLLVSIILLVSFIINVIYSPITSIHRPKKTDKTKNIFRFVSSLIILMHSINILLLNRQSYLNCYIWIIAIQSIQLIFAKEMLKNETKENT